MTCARRFVRAIACLAIACVAVAGPTIAEAQRVRDSALATDGPVRRQRLEQQLRQGIWRIAKRRIALSDDQMTKLEQTAGRFDGRRRALNQDERAQRLALRAELVAGDSGSQDRVAAALDQLLQLQRRRLDMVGEEQRELATFMTPIQRAKYSALQEQLRRRVEKMRAERRGAPAAAAR
jgi:hypothetical protein